MKIYEIAYKSRLYTVKPGDRLGEIAVRFNTTARNIKKQNGITGAAAPGDMLYIGNLDKKVHVVLPLETIGSIAEKYGVTSTHIRLLNDITAVFIGQRILV